MRSRLASAAFLAVMSSAAAGEELRTLFHTAEERSRLDRLRRGEPMEPARAAEPQRKPAVTGFVKRSDGRDTVWIDGTPQAMNAEASAPHTDPSKVRDRERSDGPAIEIKRSK